MYYLKNFTYALFALLVLFSACGEDEEPQPEPVGSPPTADAGIDLEATVNSSVTLDGSSSSDPEGALTHSWALTTRPDGSNALVSSATQATATFTPDLEGTYVATLTVTDSDDNEDTDDVTITVTEAAGEPPVASIVDEGGRAISEDNENDEVTAGTGYALDGSNSFDTDTESKDLTFTWEIVDKPEGSNAASVTAVTDNPDEAVFTPDVIGLYTIRLAVSDPEGNSASAEVTIEANASPVLVDKNIDVATVWPNVFADPDLPDYYVVADIRIEQQLTIAPGVKVIFEPNRGLSISGNSGALVAVGKADSLIVMTAKDTLNGWDGILFFNESAQNEFNYADISYGGQLDFSFGVEAANIGVENAGGFKITNSTVSHSFNYGIYLEDGGVIRTFENNTLASNSNNPISLPLNQVGTLDENSTYADNTDNTVEIQGTTLDEDEEITIPALANGVSYFVSGKISIRSGFVAMAGSSFEFDTDGTIDVVGDGYLTAEGTATDSIIFTGRDQADGWGGILFFNTNSRNSFNYARISYGGNRDFSFGVRSANIGLENAAEIKIANSRITNSVGDYGIYVEDGGVIGAFSRNSFTNNSGFPIGLPIATAGVLDAATTFSGNDDNSVEIFGSTLGGNDDPQTLPAFADNTPYYVSGRLDIDNNLEIKPGATFEFNKDVRIEVSGNDGSLEAVGTADSVITFTARDQSDGWLGIVYFTNTTANKLIYTNVSYGGRSGFSFGVEAANVGIENGGKAAIANSTFTNSLGYGVFVEGNGQVTDEAGTQLTTTQAMVDAGNTFTDNASDETNL